MKLTKPTPIQNAAKSCEGSFSFIPSQKKETTSSVNINKQYQNNAKNGEAIKSVRKKR